MRRYRHLLLPILLCCTLLTGCFDSTFILERLSISLATGFDKKNDNEIVVTTVLLSTVPKSSESSNVISVTAETSKNAKIKFDREVARQLVSGQIRSILYDRALARDGILNLADTLSRDPSFGDMVYLMVSNESSEDLLHHKYPQLDNIGLYLSQLIEQNIDRGWVLSSTIHDFRKQFYHVGMDPVLPIVERKGDIVNIKGSAIFQEDHMVGEVSAKESAYIALLNSNSKSKPDSFQVKMIKDGLGQYVNYAEKPTEFVKVSVRNLRLRGSIKLASAKDMKFDVYVDAESELQEISEDYDFSKEGARELLERELNRELENELNAFFKHIQTFKADPVGFGEVYRSSVRHSGLTKEEWREMFPRADIKAHVNINLLRTGTIE